MGSFMKYIIFTSSWNERIGGIVCLHKLCDTINRMGGEAFLYPEFEVIEVDRFKFFRSFRRAIKSYLRSNKVLEVNPNFITPLLSGNLKNLNKKDWIAIYPEVTYGNPLGAVNVVRWLLHKPGYHTGLIGYSAGDIFLKFNSAIQDLNFHGAINPDIELKVIHYPTNIYNMEAVSPKRSGTAYCIRKGRNKKIVHDTSNSVLIDGMSHFEVASIFKSVHTFYSYDTYTAYSLFAVMCGCRSVVIPDENVSIESWYPDPSDRLGIAYGLEDLDSASESAAGAIARVHEEIQSSDHNVIKFMEFCEAKFLSISN